MNNDYPHLKTAKGRKLELTSLCKKSDVWKYFQVYEDQCDHLVCLCCYHDALKVVAGNEDEFDEKCFQIKKAGKGSTTAYSNHLKHNHSVVVRESAQKQADSQINSISTLDSFVQYVGDYEKHLIQWLVEKHLPINTFNSTNFRNMIFSLNPKAPVISSPKISQHLLNNAAGTRSLLKTILKHKFYSVTIDKWTSIANDGFLGITIHFVDEAWELVSFTLSCQASKSGTAKEIEGNVFSVLQTDYELELSNCVAVVSDTENTMQCFGKSISTRGIPWIGCAAHIFDLVSSNFHCYFPIF